MPRKQQLQQPGPQLPLLPYQDQDHALNDMELEELMDPDKQLVDIPQVVDKLMDNLQVEEDNRQEDIHLAEDNQLVDTPEEDTPEEDNPVEHTPEEDTPVEDTPGEDIHAEDMTHGACIAQLHTQLGPRKALCQRGHYCARLFHP